MDHTGEYSDWYNLQSTGQAGILRSTHPEKWTPHLENGYEEGGICHDIESNGTELKMIIMNVSVTDDLDVKGGVYAFPGPLQTQLNQCLDLIRDIVMDEKKRQTSQSQPPSHSGSDAALQDMLACGDVDLKLRMDAIRPADGANIGISNSNRSLASLASLTSLTSPGGVNSGTKRRANGDGDGYRRKQSDETESLISVSTTEPAGPRTGGSEEPGDEESDFEAQTDRNLQSISLNDHGRLREFYATCFYRIQQTACRQIAQVFVRVVHPKKQTTYPYNGNRRTADKSIEKKAGKGSRRANSAAGSEAPHWWPAGAPHKEPAHMKTPDRMKLLLHILCDMKQVEDNPDNIKGVVVADLRAATDQDQTIQKMSRRVRHWLGVIYEIRGVEEDYLDGVRRERVSVHWPDNRRTRKQNEPRRRKTDDRTDRDEVALFDCDPDDASCDTPTEDQAIYTRDGNLYEGSDSDVEAENEKSLCLFMAGEGSQLDNMSTTPTQASSMKNSRHGTTQPFANMLPAMANGTGGLHGHPQMRSFADQRAHFRGAGDMQPAAMVQDSSSMEFEPAQQDHFSAIGMPQAAVGHLATQSQLGSGNLAIRSIHHHQDHTQSAREADNMAWTEGAATLAGAPYGVAYTQDPGTSGTPNQWQPLPSHDPNQLALGLQMEHIDIAPSYASHAPVSARRDSRRGRRSSGSLLQEVSNRVQIDAADQHLMPYDNMAFGGANGRPIAFEYSQ